MGGVEDFKDYKINRNSTSGGGGVGGRRQFAP